MLPKGGLQGLMKQAQKLQKDMQKAQEALENQTVEASAGGGMVSVVATGKKTVKSIRIAPEILQEDVEMVEDLIAAAVNAALKKADEMAAEKMSGLTGGMGGLGNMGIPGL